ncbi:MAG: hypothetical protein IPK98_11095 [Chloracidobacterium sp.]|nr:hypothetical protein [Chloracidobacterium sp.]
MQIIVRIILNSGSPTVSRTLDRIDQGAASVSGKKSETTALLNRADEWETPEGGGVKAVGVGSGVTGFGADLIIIDDPVRSRAHAESTNNREKIWDWYSTDLHTRLEPNAGISRPDPNTLARRRSRRPLIRASVGNGEKWGYHLTARLAGAEPGSSVERRSGFVSRRFQRRTGKKQTFLGSYSVTSLYQQR